MSNLFFRTNITPYRIDIYNALHEKLGCEMYFYWKQESSQKFNEEGMRKLCNFTPHYLKGIRLGRQSRKLCTDIWSILRKHNPQIVIVPEFQVLTIQVLLYKLLFHKKFKVISMCDDSYDMVNNDHDFTVVHKWARKLITPILDDILVVDSRVCNWYRLKYGKGIWLPIIRDEKKEIPNYLRSLPISREYVNRFDLENSKILLFVGRLDPVKNLNALIKALDKCKENFTTIIVGSGELDTELKKQASKCTRKILFAGHYVDDGIRAWYNIADVFILPSKQEAFGAVTNEALIAGNFVIVSEHAGSACLINQSNGVIIKPFEIDNMALAIDMAMRNIDKNEKEKVKSSKMPFTFDEILADVVGKIINRL